ncbi:MAG: hypothetical protein HOJ35_00355 [Bdellovibrionales bacterium]|nr:hypothetical protein [Bdellovibrionales bacterium]
MTSIYKLSIFFILSINYVFANGSSCKDDLANSVASVSLRADHPSMSYHTSIAPGHAKRSLVTLNNSLDRIKVMCSDQKLCLGAIKENVKVVQKAVDDQVFYSAMGRYQGKTLVGSDIAQNPYVASATDPTSGVYSIRHNEFPAQVNSELALSNPRSEVIQSRVENLGEHRKTYIARSGNDEFFPDNSRKAPYIDPTIRNGSDGRHAEVLAASNVLRFKDEIGQCLKLGTCGGFPTCLKSNNCDCDIDQWNQVGELYGVKIPDGFLDKCGKNPIDCFPAPPDGGHTPSTLFFDVRGADHQTITRNQSVKLKKLRINTLFNEFNNAANTEESYHNFLTRQTDTKKRIRRVDVHGGVEISSNDADNVISQIKDVCNSDIPNPMSGTGRGCHMAYLQSVHEFCKNNRESCNPPDIQEARQYVTAKITGQETSTPGIQFGAGQRCIHCFHILDGEHFHSTLGSGADPNAR